MDPFASFEPQLHAMMRGNTAAIAFLMLWRRYCHSIDDLIDGDLKGNQELLRTLALAAEVYNHPFYVEHRALLYPIARRVTIVYAVVVDWEHSPTDWKRQWADHYRHAAVEMWITIADMLGGYDHALPWVRECFATAYVQHHAPDHHPV